MPDAAVDRLSLEAANAPLHAVLSALPSTLRIPSVGDCHAQAVLAAGRAKRHSSVRDTSAEFHWGPRRLDELTRPHSRLRHAGTYRVMEGYGLPYSLLGPVFRRLFGVPFYAVHALTTSDEGERA
ncbi:hypothetical protein GCM10007205_22230 [Oxalicibacterium flavum]|uniref:Uncharacterized protein n=1 Tax=Oxalicibacterium flavum TaxID=179467 RepID=A0A8J2XXK6_9BURK|nr:hypothetical protein [Oxalicibacterium flavum]GGC12868.1 hypothetical protein GCM10007205_22230 [Oxalicibacterium flavum]